MQSKLRGREHTPQLAAVFEWNKLKPNSKNINKLTNKTYKKDCLHCSQAVSNYLVKKKKGSVTPREIKRYLLCQTSTLQLVMLHQQIKGGRQKTA